MVCPASSFISVTTVPAAGNIALGIAFGAGHEVWASSLRVMLTLLGMAAAGWATLAIQQSTWSRFESGQHSGQGGLVVAVASVGAISPACGSG